LFHFHSKSNDINVSQELVNTIVETTGKSYHDVYYFLKYAGAADMDLIEAITTIDPDLTKEEAAAIIQISDYKQNNN
jgi:hypothetical protein